MRMPYAATAGIIVEAKAIVALYNTKPGWHDTTKEEAIGFLVKHSHGAMRWRRAEQIFEEMVNSSGLTVLTRNDK
jgi:hypothetical protein